MEKLHVAIFFAFFEKNFKNPKNGTETEKPLCIM